MNYNPQVVPYINSDQNLAQAEERAEGRVAQQVYMAYIRSWGPWLLLPVLMTSCFGAERGLTVSSRVNVPGSRGWFDGPNRSVNSKPKCTCVGMIGTLHWAQKIEVQSVM